MYKKFIIRLIHEAFFKWENCGRIPDRVDLVSDFSDDYSIRFVATAGAYKLNGEKLLPAVEYRGFVSSLSGGVFLVDVGRIN